MDLTPREDLARLLATAQPVHADSAAETLPADVVEISVEGVGGLTLPLSAEQATQLVSVAEPAHFGRGEETIHDTSVRDTWQIAPRRVHLGADFWTDHLSGALDRLADELGIADDLALRVELHSLLVYAEGQFFAPHQDSEKADGMIATLVVALPSDHSGGELVVDDRGEEKRYRGSDTEATLVAFYADRRHEVLPVTAGFRATLTFTIIAESPAGAGAGSATEAGAGSDAGAGSAATDAPSESGGSRTGAAEAAVTSSSGHSRTEATEAVTTLLRRHFATPVSKRYSSAPPRPPVRLAFLLDHEYSELGIDPLWLKGADRARYTLLTAAADAADCEVALGLTEIHETYNAIPSPGFSSYDRYGYGDYHHAADGYDDDSDDDYEYGDDDAGETVDDLGELIDDDMKLTWWNDVEQPGVIDLRLSDDEVCAVTRTVDLNPLASQFEGYMGNYGNTIDRWYRRAVLIVWPRSHAFANRAEASTEWALRHIGRTIDAGDRDRARDEVRALTNVWSASSVTRREFAAALPIAAGLDDVELAADFLGPFVLEMADATTAPALTQLARTYPASFFSNLLDKWDRRMNPFRTDRVEWVMSSLLPLSRALVDHEAADLRDEVVDRVWSDMRSTIESTVPVANAPKRETALIDLGPAVSAILESADTSRAEEVAGFLSSLDERVEPLLISIVRAAVERQRTSATIPVIAARAREIIMEQLTRPPRAPDDWSIPWAVENARSRPVRPVPVTPKRGTVSAEDDVDVLARFLHSRDRTTFEWPLAKPRRQDIHAIIDRDGLPVTHTTLRTGSPHKLILTKTSELFAADDRHRNRLGGDLTWLDDHFGRG